MIIARRELDPLERFHFARILHYEGRHEEAFQVEKQTNAQLRREQKKSDE